MIRGVHFLVLSLLAFAISSAGACEYPPTGWRDDNNAILSHFCAAEFVAVVEIREVFSDLELPDRERDSIYAAHYTLLESLKGSKQEQGFLWSYREDGTCGAAFEPGEVHLLFMGHASNYTGLSAGGRLIDASGAKRADNMKVLAEVRELARLLEVYKDRCSIVPEHDLTDARITYAGAWGYPPPRATWTAPVQ
jgi:hypothetical protein